ncbi:hypothetical protein HJC23_009019 [Cyclotella cryptica]|uniref:Uncharacterized protein n=1 Tax=Cyclotella cryptica TaxID=29204 RepID=A0ABD3QZ60_9STRA|eukprot:CCRYP_000619-RB/>CCRYP_000619-RB protein AED:0.11 eAED:0.11 QI:105/1/0.96/1/0.95/0.92/25/819/2721
MKNNNSLRSFLFSLTFLGNFSFSSLSTAISFSSNATVFACPSALYTPTQLADFSGGLLLISPTSGEGELCILSRVNRNSTSKQVYIPIARSYDGNDWHRVQGRYITHVVSRCGEASEAGSGYSAGQYLCEINLPGLSEGNVGYFLTRWEEGIVSNRRAAARFLEKATWGPTWDEIIDLENKIVSQGQKSFALWVQTQQSFTPTSHRAFFRERLNPRTVESYQYGIPGPKACEKNARFRRFAFTYKDLELSRGNSGYWAGSTGLPFTPVEIETVVVSGENHYAVKFGGDIRTILPNPLKYEENGSIVTLKDGKYTLCHVEEVVGEKIGDVAYGSILFQLLVGDLCTSSYTNRGGVADGKGDGATSKENIKVGATLARIYDKNVCDAKCGNPSKVKLIQGGNPEVIVPDGFDLSTLSWIDLSSFDSSEIVNVNMERTLDSSWLLQKNLDACKDQNGDKFPNPARLAYTDYFSYGHGKYNLDKPIFAKIPGEKWALHDFRTLFKGNTADDPLEDGGGATMKAAARSGDNDDGNPDTDLVVRCSNVQRNIFNEKKCRISYHPNACSSVPLPDPNDFFKSSMRNPGEGVDELWKYIPPYAGPDNGGVVVCGSENEISPNPFEDDHFDVTNRKVEPGPIDYAAQKTTVWIEVVLAAQDQLCQRLAFGLSKIFATSTDTNADSFNTETNIGVYDNFVTSCFSTYRDVMKKVSFNQEMSEQLTFKYSKSVAVDWHKTGKLAWPDENYARENLQLHSIGLLKLSDDGTLVLDRFGRSIANYEQKHIFAAAKVWTSFKESFRRGNYEDLDYTTNSYLDPLQINEVSERDWFPKISSSGGYIGDKYPLCADLPERHFLRKGATFRLLGGSTVTLSHNDPLSWDSDKEVYRLSLNRGSQLYNKLCNPTGVSLPSSTLNPGTGIAEYDSTLLAPHCRGRNRSCDSGDLLVGRASEMNSPNTIDGCVDGEDTTETYAESVKRIRITSVNGDDLRGGDLVKIQATVISFSVQDRVDFYYASNTTSPDWTLIAIVAPIVGETDITLPYQRFPDITYTLPKCLSSTGCKQAIRVVLRSSRSVSDPSKSLPRRSDGEHKPTSNCATAPFDDVDDMIFEVLPSPRPQDICSFQTLVTLDSSLECELRECAVSTVRVVEVVPGVFYEYLHVPCVHLPFYNDAVKVFAGSGNDIYMCADKSLSSARSTCCGSYADRDLDVNYADWADVLSEYRGERLTFVGNEARCADWGRTVCDPQRIGGFSMNTGHCLHKQACRDVFSSDTDLTKSAWHWTNGSCKIKVKVNSEGLIAIIHEPQDKWTSVGSQNYPQVQSHVNENKTVSFFHVQWDTKNVAVGKLEYPHVTENDCDGGEIFDEFCICDARVDTYAVFDSIPTRDAIDSDLFVGAFDPTAMFETNDYKAVVETDADDGVSVYMKLGHNEYSEHTIFRIKDRYSNDYIFLKNVRSTVAVCRGTFFFRNSPSFFDIVDPQLISASHEIDAYLDYVDRHTNTPPFVCKSLLKHFGYSNPSPQHVLGCSNAYKSGVFIWSNPKDPSDTVSFGSGVTGDLKAISASILLSGDALSATLDSDPSFGGIKEPLHKLMHIMRSLEFKRSLSHRRTERLISNIAQDILGQVPYGIPDQFSFFSPDYSPAGAHIESSLVSPESELLNMKYVIGTQNAFIALIQNGLTSCSGGIGSFSTKGIIQTCGRTSDAPGNLTFRPSGDTSSSSNVLAQLATLLTADRLDAESRNLIESAYSAALASQGESSALKAVQTLLVSAPVFHATNKAAPLKEKRSSTPPAKEDKNEPYKAIIHLNLFGGMDSMNLLVPHPDDCSNLYEEYKIKRGENLYLTVDEIIKIDASTSDQPCTSFGINKNLGQGFVDLYNQREIIFFANIGHLQKPVTAINFMAETKTQLFSHHTMNEELFKVDAFNQRDDTGLLGRMTDKLSNNMSTSRISIDSGSNILVGDPKVGLKVDVIGARGPDQFYKSDAFSIKDAINKLNNVTKEGSSIHADLWSQSLIDSQGQSDDYASMLETVSNSNRLSSEGLGKQLNMILKVIKLHKTRKVNRDTFALTMDGFDTHFDLKSFLSLKFNEIGVELRSFRDELVNLGLWNGITVVVSSEMGRTITPNTSSGTDHGWGGHHFVLGGQLKGGKILGQHPDTYASDWKYNTGRGVWIPTTPNEAMWFGIAQWFGLMSDTDLNYVLPNIDNFGCRLYSEADLFEGGTGKVPGCGGDVMTFSQVIDVSEPRLLLPEEQKRFCAIVYDAVTAVSIKCVILDQIISARDQGGAFPRKLSQRALSPCASSNLAYTLNVTYEISAESPGVSEMISDVANSEEFKIAAATAVDMKTCVDSAEVATTPTTSPTSSPTKSPNFENFPTTSPNTFPSTPPSPSNSPSTSISTTTIEMKSSFNWNLTCSLYNDESTILYNAKIVEQSLFDMIDAELKESQSLDYVLVTEICERSVPSHNGTTGMTRRWLQMTNLSAVLFTMEATEICGNCGSNVTVGDSIFRDIARIIDNGIDSGNLTKAIQSISEWQIQAVVEPNSTSSNYTLKTETPLGSSPTTSPTEFSLSPSKEPTSHPIKRSKTQKPTYKPTSKASKKPGNTPAGSAPKASKVPKRKEVPKDPRQSKARKRRRIPFLVINGHQQNPGLSFITTDTVESNATSKLNTTHQSSSFLLNSSSKRIRHRSHLSLIARKDDSSSSSFVKKIEDSVNDTVASSVPAVALNNKRTKHQISLPGN